jgi:hypothetical protein
MVKKGATASFFMSGINTSVNNIDGEKRLLDHPFSVHVASVVTSILPLVFAFGPKGPPTRGGYLMFSGHVYFCVLCAAQPLW